MPDQRSKHSGDQNGPKPSETERELERKLVDLQICFTKLLLELEKEKAKRGEAEDSGSCESSHAGARSNSRPQLAKQHARQQSSGRVSRHQEEAKHCPTTQTILREKSNSAAQTPRHSRNKSVSFKEDNDRSASRTQSRYAPAQQSSHDLPVNISYDRHGKPKI
jgi:hypothetical protein